MTFTPTHAQTAVSLENNLTDIAIKHQKFAEATIAKYEESEALQRKALESIEKQPIYSQADLAEILRDLGFYCSRLGKFSESEQLLNRALRIDKRSKKSTKLSLAKDLNCLAILYYAQKKYVKALSFHKRALEKIESIVGPTSPELNLYLMNYAETLSCLNREKESQFLQNRVGAIMMDPAIKDCEKVLQPSSPTWNLLLPDYIELLKKVRRFDDAKVAEAKLKQSKDTVLIRKSGK